jgi:hypothetical protein
MKFKWYHWLIIIILISQFLPLGAVLRPFLILILLIIGVRILLGGLGLKANYCPHCGAKIAYGKYCKNCGRGI